MSRNRTNPKKRDQADGQHARVLGGCTAPRALRIPSGVHASLRGLRRSNVIKRRAQSHARCAVACGAADTRAAGRGGEYGRRREVPAGLTRIYRGRVHPSLQLQKYKQIANTYAEAREGAASRDTREQ